jgi:putative selenium metabolism protein SsnA
MLITNATVVTWEKPNRILANHAVLVELGVITEVAPTSQLETRYPTVSRLDAQGQLLMPGLICAHTHFYGAFARGLAIPGAAPANFVEILQKLWWPLDRALDDQGVRYSALVCLVDAIKHGTTTLVDHHASPNVIDGSLDIIADAVDTSGVRAALCYEVTDRGGAARAKAGIAENLRFLKRIKQEHPASGRLAAHFGLHASLTLSEETLAACRDAAPEGTGFHIHAAEAAADQDDSLAKTGLRVVERLHRHRMLGPESIAVHAVHVDTAEIARLAETHTWVTHQPRSNMNNAVGCAPVESMLRAGVRLGLGNDGFSNAMWEEWKAAYLLHKAWHRDSRRLSGVDVVEMAVYQNSALATQIFGTPVGVIAPGSQADLILVDYKPYTPLSPENLPWHILFGFRDSQVTATIAAGMVLMKDRQLLNLDEQEIMAHAGAAAQQTWRRYQDEFA